MVSVLMAVGGVIVAAFIVIVVMSSPKNPRRFASMIARQQRIALNTMRKNNPGMSRESLYLKAMETRTAHKENDLKALLAKKKKAASRGGGTLMFNDLVAELVIMEYRVRLPKQTHDESRYPEMISAVKAAIPDEV